MEGIHFGKRWDGLLSLFSFESLENFRGGIVLFIHLACKGSDLYVVVRVPFLFDESKALYMIVSVFMLFSALSLDNCFEIESSLS